MTFSFINVDYLILWEAYKNYNIYDIMCYILLHNILHIRVDVKLIFLT